MDEETLDLIMRLQKALCKVLVYVNRTADWAKPAQDVAQEAAIVLRQHGQVPSEVPGMVKKGLTFVLFSFTITISIMKENKIMKVIREDTNGYEVFYHGVSEWAFNRLMAEANGKVEDIVLYGRVFNPEMDLLEAESEGDYEEVKGKGYVYACDYENRENATPGASAMDGVTLILGWNGTGEDEDINKHGEYLIPLSSYRVIGVVEEER